MLARRKNGTPEFEVDFVVWTSERCASYTVRRSSVPDTTNKDALSGYFEETADRIRRNHGSLLFEPSVCLFSLSGQDDETASAIESTLSRSALAGSISLATFDWAQATKRHAGKLEGVAGEAWNEIDHVRQTGTTCIGGDEEAFLPRQCGILILYSDDGLQSVSEFLVYFSLVVAAELLRVLRGEDDNEWAGLGMGTGEVCSSLLPAKMSQVVAGFSMECSDAITFLLAHRESLFTLEVAALLPSSPAPSSLHRRVADFMQSLSEANRISQESNVALLRNSWISKRICLCSTPFAAGARRVSCCFQCFASATHLTLQFDSPTTCKPVFLSLVLDGKCVLDRLQLAVLLWPQKGVFVIKVVKQAVLFLLLTVFFWNSSLSWRGMFTAANVVTECRGLRTRLQSWISASLVWSVLEWLVSLGLLAFPWHAKPRQTSCGDGE